MLPWVKSREIIWDSQIRGAKMNAESARQRAAEAVREADRAKAYALVIRMEGYGGTCAAVSAPC